MFTLWAPVPQKTAEAVQETIIRLLASVAHRVKTLPFDTGSEFIQHEKMAAALNATIYVATLYAS